MLGGNIFYQATECTDFSAAKTRVYALARSWLITETQAGAAFCAGSNRARREPSPAIGAYIFEDILDTVGAESAFIGTYVGDGRIRWQIAVTELTIGTKFQHGSQFSRLVKFSGSSGFPSRFSRWLST